MIPKPGCKHGIASKPYSCECLSGFTGDLCDQPIRPSRSACDVNKCQNGGQCVESIRNQYFCECPIGYTGYHCEISTLEVAPEVADNQTGSDEPTDQIVLGIVIGVAIVLVVIGLIIGGFICWIRSRNSHFKHHGTSEVPEQIMESERCLDPDFNALTSVQPGTSGGVKTKIYYENSKIQNSKNSNSTTRQINNDLQTEPPSYEEVLIEKDSRDDSQIIARL